MNGGSPWCSSQIEIKIHQRTSHPVPAHGDFALRCPRSAEQRHSQTSASPSSQAWEQEHRRRAQDWLSPWRVWDWVTLNSKMALDFLPHTGSILLCAVLPGFGEGCGKVFSEFFKGALLVIILIQALLSSHLLSLACVNAFLPEWFKLMFLWGDILRWSWPTTWLYPCLVGTIACLVCCIFRLRTQDDP